MTDTSIHSNYYEKLVEHLFIADLLQTAWFNGQKQIEIARTEIDNSGYDLILECNGIIRHVQLKCSDANSSTASQKINIRLAKKPNGCVIWIVRNANEETSTFNLSYSFFGSEAGSELLPDLDSFTTARHSKANAEGKKLERPGIRVIPKRNFKKLNNTKELLEVLFNLTDWKDPVNRDVLPPICPS